MNLNIQRPTKENDENFLFENDPATPDYWWGMPEFANGDATPTKTLKINFLTMSDYRKFCELIGQKLSSQSDSAWYPKQESMKGEIEYDGPKVTTRYPVCIPSKGRYDCQKTGKTLDKMGVDYKFFVESKEADLYRQHIGAERVIEMPFSDLGQGSVPARNYIWEWAKDRGHARHWTLDDNIGAFVRCNNNRRLNCKSGNLLRAIEDFADRYTNIAAIGPHHKGFVPDRSPGLTPVLWNSRVYSCILLDTALPHRWRGRYNEDTDLCLRLLKDGYCTALFRALLMDKSTTVGVKNSKPMKGGNTDNVYNTGDHRRAFAESLRDQHPDVVKVVWKFNRWHHSVNYRSFEKNKPTLRDGVVPTGSIDNYGIELVRVNL